MFKSPCKILTIPPLMVAVLSPLLLSNLLLPICATAKLRTIRGLQATVDEFPYAVFLEGNKMDEYDLDLLFTCTGSLIREDVVLTTARCLGGTIMYINVSVGIVDTRVTQRFRQLQTARPDDFIRHPCYVPGNYCTYRYDVGMIFLPQPFVVDKSTAIQVIKLTEEKSNKFWNYKATALGWGESNVSMIKDHLMYGKFRVIPEKELLLYYDRLTNKRDNWLMSLGNDNKSKGMCVEDNGGPLIYREQQIGVLSYVAPDERGRVCFNEKVPLTFVRLGVHLDWIHHTMTWQTPLKIRCVKWSTQKDPVVETTLIEILINRSHVYGLKPTASGKKSLIVLRENDLITNNLFLFAFTYLGAMYFNLLLK